MKKIHTAETSSGAYKTASNEEKKMRHEIAKEIDMAFQPLYFNTIERVTKMRHEIAMEIDRLNRMIAKEDITSDLYVELVVMRSRLMTILHG